MPYRRTRWIVRCLVWLVGGASALGAALPATASAQLDLGSVGFGTIAVDNATHDVFVSTPQANQIDEFTFSGKLVRRISRIYGAWGMAVQGHYLYAVESTAGAIVRLDLRQCPPVPHAVTTGLNGPVWLVKTGGRLWTTVGSQWTNVVSVDPETGAQTTLPGTYYDPDLAVSRGAPNTLFIAEDGLDPGAVYRVDVSTTPATQVAVNSRTDQANIEGLAVSPDGTRVIPASGYPYLFEELSSSTLQPDGLRYPGQPYPSAVAVSASGLLAVGLDHGYSTPDLMVYPLGVPQAIWSASTNSKDGTANVVPHGIALNGNGKWLFAVTEPDDTTAGDVVFNAFSLGSS